MPERPRQHELETESQEAFRLLFPSSWVIRKVDDNDYGVDLEVEIFESGAATGLTFKVQLKGTDKAPKRGRISLSGIKRQTLNYWRELDVPVLVVLYTAGPKALYARWAHSFDNYYSKDPASQTVTIAFRTEHHLNGTWMDRLAGEVRFIRAVTTRSVKVPLLVALEPTKGARGFSDQRIRAEIRRAVSHAQGIVSLVDPGSFAARITISDSEIRIALPTEVRSTTLHLDDIAYGGEKGIEALAADVMIGISQILLAMGDTGSAERLLRIFADSSEALYEGTGLPLLLKLFLDAGKVSAVYFLIEPLIDSLSAGRREIAELVMVKLHCMPGHYRLTAEELDRSIQRLHRRAEIEKGEGRSVKAGRTLYNIGEMYRANREYDKGLEAFDAALVEDPSYARRGYFWRARGSLHYELDNYGAAEADYRKAIECGDSPEASLLLSDVLMRQGRYIEALAVELRPDAQDFYALGERINRQVLASVIDLAGVTQQDRQPVPPELLSTLQESPTREGIIDALRTYDALDVGLWHLLVRTLWDSPNNALKAMIVMADLVRSNPTLWAMAACIGVEVGATDADIDDMCDSALRWCGTETEFLDAIEQFARHEEDAPGLIEKVKAKAYARTEAARPRWPRVARLIGDDGTYRVEEVP